MPKPSTPSPWADAIATADETGRTAELVDLILNPRVEIDRMALADLLQGKYLRNVRETHKRNAAVREEYARLRKAGHSVDDALAICAEKFRVDERAIIALVNRRDQDMRWKPTRSSMDSTPQR